MLLINFSHPISVEQRVAVEKLAGQKITGLIEQMAHFEPGQSLAGQVQTLVDQIKLGPVEWQQVPFVVQLPALNYGAAAVLAELHGRCGYFPAVVRLSLMEGSLPPRYGVAEIVNLQAIRETARQRR